MRVECDNRVMSKVMGSKVMSKVRIVKMFEREERGIELR